MSDNKQLIRKENGGGYRNIYPFSFTETVKDKKTGKSLEEILVGTNFLYLPYRGSNAATRLQVDERYRRKGLWIQYITNLDSLIVEYYNNEDVSNNKWIDDRYWVPYSSAQLNPGTIGLDAISQEAKDYLLTNSPVNTEDITRDSQSRLQLADRRYNPETPNGKGYKILRPNILNGVNTLAQSMITEANTIYEIRYDYDLLGEEITIPEGCILKFEGGSLINGILNFNNTFIESGLSYILKNLQFKGICSNEFCYPEWFGAKCDGVNDDSIAINIACNNFNVSKIILSSRTYYIKQSIILDKDSITIEGSGYNTIILKDTDEDGIISTKTTSYITLSNFLLQGKNNIGSGIKSINHNLTSLRIIDVCISRCDYGIYLNNSYVLRINLSQIVNNNVGIYIESVHGGSIHEVAVTTNKIGIQLVNTLGVSITNSCIQDGDVGVFSYRNTGIAILNNYIENMKQCIVIGNDTYTDDNVIIQGGRYSGLGKDNTESIGILINKGANITISNVYISSVYSKIKCIDESVKNINLYNINSGLYNELITAPNYDEITINNNRIGVGNTDRRPDISKGPNGRLFYDRTVKSLLVSISRSWFGMDSCIAHNIKGQTSERPIDLGYNVNYQGAYFYDLSLGRPIYWNGYRWIDTNGFEVNRKSGNTAEIPVFYTNKNDGYCYFNTDINQPIYRKGEQWYTFDGEMYNIRRNGLFSQRPNNPQVGFAYFCTDKQTSEGSTNGIVIYHKGDNVWVDALGRVIS